jgi:hypothetical protein
MDGYGVIISRFQMAGIYGNPPLCVKGKSLAQDAEDWKITVDEGFASAMVLRECKGGEPEIC